MFAVVIADELVAAQVSATEVQKILRDRRFDGKQEVASFDFARGGWVPVCLERFALAA